MLTFIKKKIFSRGKINNIAHIWLIQSQYDFSEKLVSLNHDSQRENSCEISKGMMNDPKDKGGKTIVFNSSKNEAMTLNENFKTLVRKLKGSWKIILNKEEISPEILEDVALFILPGPREKFTESEFNCLKKFIETGGSILVLLGEGGEKNYHTNINFLLEEYGIMVNNDVVVRTTYYKYFNPKECLVVDGVVNRGVLHAVSQILPQYSDHKIKSLSFVFPFGATLNVARPAITLLSSGSVAFPVNRPVAAVYSTSGFTNKMPGGKLAVIGSVHFLSDQYVDKEDNDKIREIIFKFLTTPEVELNPVDADDPEIADYLMVPDTSMLAERPRVCLQEPTDEIPTDYIKLFSNKLYAIHTSLVPDAMDAYPMLQVKHEPLRLITPQFETPLPLLQAAVFPPSFQELQPPPLELFDLDDAFSSERSRLAQLANKCVVGLTETDEVETDSADLEFFVRECGRILNVIVPGSTDPDAKQILHQIASQVAEYKKLPRND
ncbi:Intraflagellar transport protein 52-like protein [Gryllus bimaculatus]|nr:Intraflagellar transport protein 52-like protein [Gryllus bimaculatus]